MRTQVPDLRIYSISPIPHVLHLHFMLYVLRTETCSLCVSCWKRLKPGLWGMWSFYSSQYPIHLDRFQTIESILKISSPIELLFWSVSNWYQLVSWAQLSIDRPIHICFGPKITKWQRLLIFEAELSFEVVEDKKVKFEECYHLPTAPTYFTIKAGFHIAVSAGDRTAGSAGTWLGYAASTSLLDPRLCLDS